LAFLDDHFRNDIKNNICAIRDITRPYKDQDGSQLFHLGLTGENSIFYLDQDNLSKYQKTNEIIDNYISKNKLSCSKFT
jgi:hypothetical protein